MAVKRFQTKFHGVRYREHLTRKQGIKRDRYFSIYYRLDGKRREEGIGWASDGWTTEKAAILLAKLKEAQKIGEGPQTLAEKRGAEKSRRLQANQASITFGSFYRDSYLPQAKSNKTMKSWVREDELFRIWIKPTISHLPLKNVSPIHLERIKKNMLDEGRSARSIHYALAVIRQVYNYARNIGVFVGENPVSKVKKPTADNRRVRFLTREDADLLLTTLQGKSPEVADMALLSLHTGLRAGEIFSLKWSDVDLARGTLLVRDAKSGKSRYAFMTREVKQMFSKNDRSEGEDLVFASRDGKTIQRISNSFNRIIDQLGLNQGITDSRQKVCFHTLRHTYASWLVESGTDLYTVKKLMGHGSIAMTERYSHLGENTLQKAVRDFEKSIRIQTG
jgi:site-specific recombinase XerD